MAIMKRNDKTKAGFIIPTVLDRETLILGVPIREWDNYLTGEIAYTLAKLKEQVSKEPDAS